MMCYFLKCLVVVFLMTVGRVTGRAVSDIRNPVLPNSNSYCRRPQSSYVCDPDGLLTVHEGKLWYHYTIGTLAMFTGQKEAA